MWLDNHKHNVIDNHKHKYDRQLYIRFDSNRKVFLNLLQRQMYLPNWFKNFNIIII